MNDQEREHLRKFMMLEQLGMLAFQFRGDRDETKRREIAEEYAKIWEALLVLGPDEFPPPEDMLPRDYMPKSFYKAALGKKPDWVEMETISQKVKVGDYVQWTCGGVDMFVEPRKIVTITSCESFVFVEGTNTGIPISELSVIEGGK
jgi:hypothetical protein